MVTFCSTFSKNDVITTEFGNSSNSFHFVKMFVSLLNYRWISIQTWNWTRLTVSLAVSLMTKCNDRFVTNLWFSIKIWDFCRTRLQVKWWTNEKFTFNPKIVCYLRKKKRCDLFFNWKRNIFKAIRFVERECYCLEKQK